MNENTSLVSMLLTEPEPAANPLAWNLSRRHAGQLEEIEEFLEGIGYLVEPSGVTCVDTHGGPVTVPVPDEECKMAEINLCHAESVDVTGDIPKQVAAVLARIGRRLLRVSRRIADADRAGKLTVEPNPGIHYCVAREGRRSVLFDTRKQAEEYALEFGGMLFEKCVHDV